MPDALDLIIGTNNLQKEKKKMPPASKTKTGDNSALDLILGTSSESPSPQLSDKDAYREQLRALDERVIEKGKVMGNLFFDIISRPGYVVGNLADLVTNRVPDTWGEVGRAVTQGLTGKRKGTWQTSTARLPEAVDVFGLPVRRTLGFGLDVLADPSDRFGLGANVIDDTGKYSRQLFSYAGTGWESLPGVLGKGAAKVDEKLFQTLSDVADAARSTKLGRYLMEKFSTRGVMADDDFWRRYQRAMTEGDYFAREAVKKGAAKEKELAAIEKGTGTPRADIMELIEKPEVTEVSRATQTKLPLLKKPEMTVPIKTVNRTFTVEAKAGDTLSELAEKYGTHVDQLMKLNKISDPDKLRVGQKIRIPTGQVEGQLALYKDPKLEEKLKKGKLPPEDANRLLPRKSEGFLQTVEPAVPLKVKPENLGKVTTKTSQLTGKPQAVVDVVRKYGQENSQRLAIEQAAGIDVKALDSDVIDYMYHARTPEAKRAARKAGVAWTPAMDITVQHGSTKARSIKDLTVKEINELNAQGKLNIIPGYTGKLYEDNPALVQTLRDVVSAKALAAAEFLDDVIKNPEWAIKEGPAPANWVELSDAAVANRFGPKVKGVKFRPDIAQSLTRYIKKEFDPKQVDGFWKYYDKALGAWRAITLGFSPSWLRNNVIGNVWNNYLEDVSPTQYVKAGLMQAGKPAVVVTKSGKTYTTKQVMEMAPRLGILDFGLTADARRGVLEGADSGTKLFMFRVNRTVENNSRLAHFLDRLEKGMTPEAAAESVNHTLFNYLDLTDWEQNVAKRIWPFYTWYKKNAVLQFEHMITTPGKYSIIPKFQRAVEFKQEQEGTLEDKQYLPPWMKDALPMQTGTTPEGNVVYRTLRGVPALETVKGVNEIASVNPFLTAAMQAGLGFDPYYREMIPETADTLLGVAMPEKYARALKTLAPPLKTLDDLINPREAPPWSSVETPKLGERLGSMVFGKTYERDPLSDYANAMRTWDERMSELQRKLAIAEEQGNKPLAAWYQRQINALWKEIEE